MTAPTNDELAVRLEARARGLARGLPSSPDESTADLLRAAASRIKALEEALAPFAAFLDALERIGGPSRLTKDDDTFYEIGAYDNHRSITLGDFRRARSTLQGSKP